MKRPATPTRRPSSRQPDGSVIVAGDSYAYDTHPSGRLRLRPRQVHPRREARPELRRPRLRGDLAGERSNGVPDTATTALASRPTRKIVVVGMARARGTDRIRFALARYEPDGSLDPTFGDHGIVITGFPAQQGSVAARCLRRAGRSSLGERRRAGDARPLPQRRIADRSFGGDGIVALAGARSVKTLRAVGLSRNGRTSSRAHAASRLVLGRDGRARR